MASGNSEPISSVTSSVSSIPSDADQSDSPMRRLPRTKVLYFWSCEDVLKWLRRRGGDYFRLYADKFRNHDINGRTLVRMTESKLLLMGITEPVHREDLMRHILRLRLKTDVQEIRRGNGKRGPPGKHPQPPAPQGQLPQPSAPQGQLPQPPAPQGQLPQPPAPQGQLPQPPAPQGQLPQPAGVESPKQPEKPQPPPQ